MSIGRASDKFFTGRIFSFFVPREMET